MDLRGHGAEAGVDPREEVSAAPARAALDPPDGGVVGAGLLQLPHVLGAVKAAARHRDLIHGSSRERLDAPGLQNDRRGLLVVPVARLLQERSGNPGSQTFRRERRESGRVAGQAVRLARGDPGRLVLAVSVARGAVEDTDDDLRTKPPHDADRVLEEDVLRPLAERFVERARETEVVRPGEVLAGAVQPPRRRQLLRAHEAEPDAEVGSDEILSALAARQRKVRSLAAEAARHVRQDLGVLVVGVRADHEEAPVRPQAPERAIEGLEAAGRRGRERVARRRGIAGRRRGRGQTERRERGGPDPRRVPRGGRENGRTPAHYFLRVFRTRGADAAAAAPSRAARMRAFFRGSIPFHSLARRVTVWRDAFEALPTARRTAVAP